MRALQNIDSKWVIALVAFAAIGAGVVTTLRGCSIRGEENARIAAVQREFEATIAEGRLQYDRMAVRPLSAFGDVADLRRLVESMRPLPSADLATAADVKNLLDQTADFLYYRFGQDSPKAYRDWRDGAEYVTKDLESHARAGAVADYERFVRKEGQGAAEYSAAKLFDGLWEALGETSIGKSSRLTGIAAEPAGWSVAFGEMDAFESRSAPILTGELPAILWKGKIQGGARLWWLDPHGGIKKVLASQGRVPAALVGVVVETREAGRFPLSLSYFKDAAGRWWLWRLNVHNVNPSTVLQIDY